MYDDAEGSLPIPLVAALGRDTADPSPDRRVEEAIPAPPKAAPPLALSDTELLLPDASALLVDPAAAGPIIWDS